MKGKIYLKRRREILLLQISSHLTSTRLAHTPQMQIKAHKTNYSIFFFSLDNNTLNFIFGIWNVCLFHLLVEKGYERSQHHQQ